MLRKPKSTAWEGVYTQSIHRATQTSKKLCPHLVEMWLTSRAKARGRDAVPGSEKKTMADERTPLVATVRTAPPRQRYPHHTLRRFCTVALTCSLLALFTVFLFTFGFSEPLGHHRHRPQPDWDWAWPDCKERKLSYAELKDILLETPSSEKAEEWQRYYTAGAHLAGQNYSQVRTYAVHSHDVMI